jgi:copper chaperone CopZ
VRSALEGTGVAKVDVSFDKKEAIVHFDPQQTKSKDLLDRLTKNPSYAKSKIESLAAEVDGDYARITAIAKDGKVKKGGKGQILITIEPKPDHTLNGSGRPDLEIELKAKDGVSSKNPLQKDKKGVTKKRDFKVDFEVGAKVEGELGVEVEVRLVDVVKKAKEGTAKVVHLVVPVPVT